MRMSIPSKHQCLFSKLAARIGAYTCGGACIHEQISVKQYGSIQQYWYENITGNLDTCTYISFRPSVSLLVTPCHTHVGSLKPEVLLTINRLLPNPSFQLILELQWNPAQRTPDIYYIYNEMPIVLPFTSILKQLLNSEVPLLSIMGTFALIIVHKQYLTTLIQHSLVDNFCPLSLLELTT